MKRVKNDAKAALLFMDASHFVMGCDFLGYVYARTRRFIRTFSGRKRYNVLGALDFVAGRVLSVTNDAYITATQVCGMLRKISAQTVHVVLDNARCRKCQAVREFALKLGSELLYIPPYSPNLNLIERFWKFVKGELRSKYYDNFNLFQQKINALIQSATGINRNRVAKLIGEKVQFFDDLRLINENTFVNLKSKSYKCWQMFSLISIALFLPFFKVSEQV